MHLRTAFGLVPLKVWRGKDSADGHWGCPMRERWGLSAHQQLSPALEDRLAYFGTVASSYEAAAKLAGKLGCSVEDTTLRALVQRLGAQAAAQVQARLEQAPAEQEPARAAARCLLSTSHTATACFIRPPRLELPWPPRPMKPMRTNSLGFSPVAAWVRLRKRWGKARPVATPSEVLRVRRRNSRRGMRARLDMDGVIGLRAAFVNRGPPAARVSGRRTSRALS